MDGLTSRIENIFAQKVDSFIKPFTAKSAASGDPKEFLRKLAEECDTDSEPVIGIVSQSCAPDLTDKGTVDKGPNAEWSTWIMSAYVRWLEQYGARSIPILCDEDINVTYEKMKYINGILFPGGAGDYVENGKLILKKVMEINDSGRFFPMWGTCLGIETFAEWTATVEKKVLEEISVQQRCIPISLTPDADKSKMFSFFGSEVTLLLQTGNHTYNWHTYGIRPSTFQNDPKLRDFWLVTSTSVSDADETFVATVEARNYPIMAI